MVFSEAWSPRAAAVTHRADKTQVPDDSAERKKWVVPSGNPVPAALSFFTSVAFKVDADAVLKYFNQYPANTDVKLQYFSVVWGAWKEVGKISNLQARYRTRMYKGCIFTAFQLDISLSFVKTPTPLTHPWLLVWKRSTVDRRQIHLRTVMQRKKKNLHTVEKLQKCWCLNGCWDTGELLNVQLGAEGWVSEKNTRRLTTS